MKRREFVVRSAVGSVALGAGHLPFATVNPESNPQPLARAATRKILIAGGGFNTAFIRYMAALTGKPRPKTLLSADGVRRQPGRHDLVVSELRAAQRRAARADELHRQHASRPRAGTKSSSRWTASSAPAATR